MTWPSGVKYLVFTFVILKIFIVLDKMYFWLDLYFRYS